MRDKAASVNRSYKLVPGSNSLDTLAVKWHIRMANQSVLRKKFPEDFFAQASTQL